MATPHFRLPLDLPHAGTITMRIAHVLLPRIDSPKDEHQKVLHALRALEDLLYPFNTSGENGPPKDALAAREKAAALAREIVEEVVRLNLTNDRFGQHIRNLFECLELGEEGATISLKAGEDPKSLQRPI